jgi:hypothetical protein
VLRAQKLLITLYFTGTGQQNVLADPKNQPFKMVNNSPILPIIPAYARDAPRFSLTKPQELPRFLQHMEDMWNGAGIVDDETRKSHLGKYADQQSEDEWRTLDTYQLGFTWLEFKAELVANYPEVAAAERGTPARIRQLCREWEGIGLGELGALYAFRRAFLSQAKKLLMAPAVMSNRELVELFLWTLSEKMRSAVVNFLGSRAGAKSKQRRPEDQYDLREVCKMAVVVSENAHVMFCRTERDFSESVNERKAVVEDVPVLKTTSFAQRLNDLTNSQVRNREELEIVNERISQRLSSLTDMMTTYLQQVQGDSEMKEPVLDNFSTGTGLGTSSAMPRWGGLMKANDGGNCFYCGQVGHNIAQCDQVKLDIEDGLLRFDANGKLRLYNGDCIPNMPNAPTLKDRVERYYAEKCRQYVANEEDDDAPYIVRPSSSFSYPSHYSYVAKDPIDREVYLKPALDLEDRERHSQYVCKEEKDVYAPYIATPEPISPYYYEPATWDEDFVRRHNVSMGMFC